MAVLPFMGEGHSMPLIYLSRLLCHGLAVTVTILITSCYASFIRTRVKAAIVVELPFPSGVDGPQST